MVDCFGTPLIMFIVLKQTGEVIVRTVIYALNVKFKVTFP